jgi:hypothetical protein
MRVAKVAAWTAAFLACAGVGAYVAAHTNPFPPGVDRPSEAAASPTPSPPGPDRWRGTMRSFTTHAYYVGGRCITRWRGTLVFEVGERGRFLGTGRFRLDGRLECDFPVEQVQARGVDVTVSGTIRADRLRLSISEDGLRPLGSADYGGLVGALPLRVELRVRPSNEVADRVAVRRTDEQGRGTYEASTGLRLRCTNCAEA